MGFLNSVFRQKITDLHDGLASAITNIDPIGASEAEIAEMMRGVDTLAMNAATAQGKVQEAEGVVKTLTVQKDRYMKAITNERAKTAPDQSLVLKLVDQAESINGKLTDANTSLTRATASFERSKQNHAAAASKLTTMRAALDEARANVANSKAELAAADQEKRDAQIAANILKGTGSATSALSIMQDQAKQLQTQVAAAQMTSEAITHKPSEDVEAALAAVDGAPEPTSIEERLKALGG